MTGDWTMNIRMLVVLITMTFTGMAQAESLLLFSDAYTASANSNDINFEWNSGRQGGSIAPLRYKEGSDTAAGGVFDSVSQINKSEAPGALFMGLSSSYTWLAVSPDHDFGWLRDANYEVYIDPQISGSTYTDDHWAALVIGANPNAFPTTSPGIAFWVNRQNPTGVYQIIVDGAVQVTSSSFAHHTNAYKLNITVTSGNILSFYLDNILVYSMTRTGSSPINYISLVGRGAGAASQKHTFDNLKVTASILEPTAQTPPLWIAPSPWPGDGRGLRELVKRDTEWADTRNKITGLLYWPALLNAHFNDAELSEFFGKLTTWNKKLALEVPALKAELPNAAQSFALLQTQMSRFTPLGINGKLASFVLDEPYYAARHVLNQTDEFAIEQTATYIVSVRGAYAGKTVGDTEPYPSMTLAQLENWITQLDARLQSKGSARLDFFRLDVDWASMNGAGSTSWAEVKALEDFCRARNTKFGLIYWAADQPYLEAGGNLDNLTSLGWYSGVMSEGAAYLNAGGLPDEYIIESWLPNAPQHAVPETQKTTLTASVLDFYRRFIQQRR
jgi:hypothetical protein